MQKFDSLLGLEVEQDMIYVYLLWQETDSSVIKFVRKHPLFKYDKMHKLFEIITGALHKNGSNFRLKDLN